MAWRRGLQIVLPSAFVSATGAAYLVKDVQQCEVPAGSLLSYTKETRKVWYHDCFKTTLPSGLHSRSNAHATDALCKAFFRTWPMRMELWLVSLFNGELPTDSQILEKAFVEDDSVSWFKVILRGSREVLFDDGDSAAFTWLSIRRDDTGCITEVLLGSALPGAGYRGLPLHLYLLYQLAMPLHGFYSRLLLSQAAKQLQNDFSKSPSA